jgi:hypothetical protein
MKKFSEWFNNLSPVRQKCTLVLFCLTFMLLLIMSLNSNKVTIKPGYVPQHIGRTTDSLTLKK